jgi:uncharacterized RDD family membrane protein YckC
MSFYPQEETKDHFHPYAGFWTRFIALLLDALLMSVVSVLLFIAFGFPLALQPDDIEAQLWLNLASVGLGWFYYAGMESSVYQATLGKQVMGIFVTDELGQRISFARATGRYFAKLLSGTILLIGYIMAAFTAKRQALHDIMAGTLVYKH